MAIDGPKALAMQFTTRFALRNGVVTSWTFDGLVCGAPT
jgi:hypothetical protein